MGIFADAMALWFSRVLIIGQTKGDDRPDFGQEKDELLFCRIIGDVSNWDRFGRRGREREREADQKQNDPSH
jgi:hypothetical protein